MVFGFVSLISDKCRCKLVETGRVIGSYYTVILCWTALYDRHHSVCECSNLVVAAFDFNSCFHNALCFCSFFVLFDTQIYNYSD